MRATRTKALLGTEGMEKLNKSVIVLAGLGGVGGQVFEALVRCGAGYLILIDFDTVSPTDLNRQILATADSMDTLKTEAARKRASVIEPGTKISTINMKIEKLDDLDFLKDSKIDYIIDAIDGFEGKISLVCYAKTHNIPVISSMGMGNRLDPQKIRLADICETNGCPLARKMRQRLRKEDIKALKVVYSTEQPICHDNDFIGSVPFVPAAAGLVIAAEVVKDIIF
jgi:tRNA threonylcarbamoyladenosine dehydratase